MLSIPKIRSENEYLGGTFRPNKVEPVHRWYPYMEGFSGEFVGRVLDEFVGDTRMVLDPFSGCGTTGVEAFVRGLHTIGIEINPFMTFVADTKTNGLAALQRALQGGRVDLSEFCNYFFLLQMEAGEPPDREDVLSALYLDKEYFATPVLEKIKAIKTWILKQEQESPELGGILRLALAAILVEVSNMTRAADLRYRKNRLVDAPIYQLYGDMLQRFERDALSITIEPGGKAEFETSDARQMQIREKEVDLIVTSPPYLNGTNYCRNTKLELWVFDFVQSGRDLRSIRDGMIPAGINAVHAEDSDRSRFDSVNRVVEAVKEKAYDRRIPKMVASYFDEMSLALQEMHRVLKVGGRAVVVIGDSAFAGVHVPTDALLAELAIDASFRLESFTPVRRRKSRGGMGLQESVIVLRRK